MWIVNVVVISAAIACISWFFLNYGHDLNKATGMLLSASQSVLFAIGFILFEATKAAIVSALAGGLLGLVFVVAGAPDQTSQIAATSVACLTFFLLLIKVVLDNLNNLRWSIRNEVRNRYRKR